MARQIAGEYILVPIRQSAGEVESIYTLNEVGTRIWELLDGQRSLLESNPELAQRIRERMPYVEPLNHLQVELLKRHRQGRIDARGKRGIHLTINGVSAGLRNTG